MYNIFYQIVINFIVFSTTVIQLYQLGDFAL